MEGKRGVSVLVLGPILEGDLKSSCLAQVFFEDQQS